MAIHTDSNYHSRLNLNLVRAWYQTQQKTAVNTHTILRSGVAIFLIAMTLFAQPAAAAGDVEQGKQIGFTCMGCHGIAGYRNAYPSFRVPRLGGQQGAYIEAALRAYREGTRKHPTMRAHAASLTDQDIENLIAWITASGDARDTVSTQTAAHVAPAATCVACHGADGEGVTPQPPTLAGQEVDYLEYALNQYKDGSRSGTVMTAFTASLSEADIVLLAKFYGSQDGLKTLQQ